MASCYRQARAGSDTSLPLRQQTTSAYQRLAAGLDYLADGRYRLRLRLEGHNPELYQGHPIDFNLNVNGELPGLLQGALLSGDFNTYLLKQLQQGKLE
jgi:Dicarboxylate transport